MLTTRFLFVFLLFAICTPLGHHPLLAQHQEIAAFDIVLANRLPEPIQFDRDWVKSRMIREITAYHYLKRPDDPQRPENIMKFKFDDEGRLKQFFSGGKFRDRYHWQFDYPAEGCPVLYELTGRSQLKTEGLEEYRCDSAGRLIVVELSQTVDSIVYDLSGNLSERHITWRAGQNSPATDIFITLWFRGPEGRIERMIQSQGSRNNNDSLVYCQSGIATYEYIGDLLTRSYSRSAEVRFFPEINRFDTIANTTLQADCLHDQGRIRAMTFIENDQYLGEMEVRLEFKLTENDLISELLYTKKDSRNGKPFYRIKLSYEFRDQ